MATKKTSTPKTNKLPTKFKAKWLEALRSGKYKQGQNRLYTRHNDGYCCLGVACRVVHPKIKIQDADYYIDNKFTKVPAMLKGNSSNEIVRRLSKLNDNDGFDFKQIADYIEANY